MVGGLDLLNANQATHSLLLQDISMILPRKQSDTQGNKNILLVVRHVCDYLRAGIHPRYYTLRTKLINLIHKRTEVT
jgi:hypothetical protein